MNKALTGVQWRYQCQKQSPVPLCCLILTACRLPAEVHAALVVLHAAAAELAELQACSFKQS
jgi:hypothetical protein